MNATEALAAVLEKAEESKRSVHGRLALTDEIQKIAASYLGGEPESVYTPTAMQVRATWSLVGFGDHPDRNRKAEAGFDEWLRRVMAGAWEKGRAAGSQPMTQPNPYRSPNA